MKFLDPKFLTGIVTIIAITLNNRFGWHLDPQQLVASIALSLNFILMQLAVDIQKMKNGEATGFNSTKLAMLFIACLIIGFTQYLGIELSDEEIWWIAGVAAAFITGKGVKDLVQAKDTPKTPFYRDDHAV